MWSDLNMRSAALVIGVSVVALTHTYFIVLPGTLSATQKQYHSYFNLAAAGVIVYGAKLLG